MSHAHFWDLTPVGAPGKVVLKFRREGAEAEIFGLSGAIGIDASAHLTDELKKVEEAQGRVQRLNGKGIIEAMATEWRLGNSVPKGWAALPSAARSSDEPRSHGRTARSLRTKRRLMFMG